jgi:hypothetical protein
MRHIVMFDLPDSTTFLRIISLTARFKKKNVNERKINVLIFSTN